MYELIIRQSFYDFRLKIRFQLFGIFDSLGIDVPFTHAIDVHVAESENLSFQALADVRSRKAHEYDLFLPYVDDSLVDDYFIVVKFNAVFLGFDDFID